MVSPGKVAPNQVTLWVVICYPKCSSLNCSHAGKRKSVVLKALVIEDSLACHWMSVGAKEEEPTMFNLKVADYTTDATGKPEDPRHPGYPKAGQDPLTYFHAPICISSSYCYSEGSD